MKPEEQIIAIAQVCGWTCCGCVEGCKPHGLHPRHSLDDFTTAQVLAGEVPTQDLPDYLNDLNAMHAAEKVLSEWQDREYRDMLIKMTACGEHRATAGQRAEAFLRTLHLWWD